MADTDKKILFIEDDKVDQLAFKRFVKAENLPYDFVMAGSVAEAKDVLATAEDFDIVITDYRLGDGTASDIFPWIKETPVIVVTTGGDEKVAVQVMKTGAYEYLIKDSEYNYLKLLPITVDNAIKHKHSETRSRMLSHAVTNINESVCITDEADNIIFVNEAFSKIYGYEPQEVLGRPYSLIGSDRTLIKTEGPRELYHTCKGGEEISVSLSRSVLRNERGYEVAVVEVARDITKRKQAEEALEYRVRFEKVITTLSTLFIYLSPDEISSGIEIALQTVGEFTNADLSYAILLSQDKSTVDKVHEWRAEGVGSLMGRLQGLSLDAFPWAMDKLLQFQNIAVPRLTDLPAEASGEKELLQSLGIQSFIAVPIIHSRSLIGFLSLASVRAEQEWSEDVISLTRIVAELLANALERMRTGEALRRQAFYDELTGLPNRALFLDRLRYSIMRAKQEEDYAFAVLFLDLDHFKVVNDSLGHQAGDYLLKVIARRLKESLRTSDSVARLGGDEFVILLSGIVSANDATQVADRIQEYLSLPIEINGHKTFTEASIGIFLSTTAHHDEPTDILRDADIAMYEAKSRGRAHYRIFRGPMRVQAMSRLNSETELRQAIERQEFRVFYQPIVSLATGQITGMEALVRWQHPFRGLLTPAEFLPLAEETRLIVPIGNWVLRTACQQISNWCEAGYSSLPLRVAVNISAGQFQQSNLPEKIKQVIETVGISPEALELEITEDIALIEDFKISSAVLNDLKALGVRISIDDLGIGYSSLSYVKYFPIDTLKIDRSFVNGINRDSKDKAITKTIISLSNSLDFNVIAEGVETEGQLHFLQSHGCDEMQGYLFSRPLPAKEMAKLLQSGSGLAANTRERAGEFS